MTGSSVSCDGRDVADRGHRVERPAPAADRWAQTARRLPPGSHADGSGSAAMSCVEVSREPAETDRVLPSWVI